MALLTGNQQIIRETLRAYETTYMYRHRHGRTIGADQVSLFFAADTGGFADMRDCQHVADYITAIHRAVSGDFQDDGFFVVYFDKAIISDKGVIKFQTIEAFEDAIAMFVFERV